MEEYDVLDGKTEWPNHHACLKERTTAEGGTVGRGDGCSTVTGGQQAMTSWNECAACSTQLHITTQTSRGDNAQGAVRRKSSVVGMRCETLSSCERSDRKQQVQPINRPALVGKVAGSTRHTQHSDDCYYDRSMIGVDWVELDWSDCVRVSLCVPAVDRTRGLNDSAG